MTLRQTFTGFLKDTGNEKLNIHYFCMKLYFGTYLKKTSHFAHYMASALQRNIGLAFVTVWTIHCVHAKWLTSPGNLLQF